MKKVLLLFTLAIIASCSSDESPKNDDDTAVEKNLQGKWSWVSTTNGVDGTKITSETEKKTIVLEFSGTNFKKYTNGVLSMDTTFEVLTQEMVEGNPPIQTLVTLGPTRITNKKSMTVSPTSYEAITLNGNKLKLSLFCNKCNSSEYVKIK